MARNNSRSSGAFDKMKYEVAREVGINLKEGYNGDLASRDAGKIGGTIVKHVFSQFRDSSAQK